MTSLVACILLIVAINSSESFNLSPESRIIISDPAQQEGSYFGYSVHLRSAFDRYAASIVVGAPRANSTYTNHRQINEPGVVYQCNVDEFIEITPICYPLLLDKTGEVQVTPRIKHRKNHSWLGAALDGQSNRGGRFIACAPRWVNQNYLVSKQILLNNGMCYWISDTTDANRTADQLFPLVNPILQNFKAKARRYYGYAFGQAGFSVHMTKDDGSEILVGAPGVFNWKGGVIRYKDTYSDVDFNSKHFHSIPYSDIIIPNTYYNSKIRFDSLFGYSLGSGIFLSEFPTKRWYVAGAPRDAKYKGRVFLFDLRDNIITKKQEILIKKEFEGQQFGEYFGSSVCLTDVNGDGLDDVLIGAPRYSIDREIIETGDEGAVYVFINKDFWNFHEQSKLQSAQKPRAEFGSCISTLGDLDFDGYNDVVVGAPYEDNGRGAIYIYLGSAKGLRPNPSQHIRAINVDSNLYGFGISVSKGVDIDNNLYNDLAVGAYLSGNIVLFRSQPVVRLSGRIEPLVTEIGLNTTEFSVNACVIYNGTHVPNLALISIDVSVDPSFKRAAFTVGDGKIENSMKKMVNIEIGQEVCAEMLVEIQDFSQDFSIPLEIRMQYGLHENNSKVLSSFCSSCPVSDPLFKNMVNSFLPYSTGCGNDENCMPDLTISANFINISDAFVLGTRRSVFFNVTINNIGEPAFLTRLLLTMPDDLQFVQIPDYCNDQEQSFTCNLGSVLFGEERTIIFELDTLNLKVDAIEVSLAIKSAGDERNVTDNNALLFMPLISMAEFKITSKSMPEQTSFKSNKEIIKGEITPIYHEYIIQNLGPSPVSNSLIQFYIPIAYDNITLFNVMEPETSIGSQSINCNASWPGFIGNINKDEESSTFEVSRTREDIDINEKLASFESIVLEVNNNYDLPANRTMSFKCTKNVDQTTCMVVSCELMSLKNSQTKAFIKFLIQPMYANIDTVLNEKDVFHMEVVSVLTPLITINSSSNGVISTTLETTLIRELAAEKIPHFWITLAVALGLLLLAFIMSGLIKLGFFKRTMKDELNLLKGQSYECQEFESWID